MNKALRDKVGKDATGQKCFKVYKDNGVQCPDCPLKRPLEVGETDVVETEGAFGGRIIRIKHKAIKLRSKKYILEIFEDITASITDALTGCFNRRKLKTDLEEELNRAKRYENELSILMIDIDWFKEYNDFHGHQKGDDLLVELVGILNRNIRFTDKLYRYGGEEFVILLPETGEGEIKEVAEKLRRRVTENEFSGAEKSQPNDNVSISIGVAGYPKNGDSSVEIIRAADTALYEAKMAGKNTVKIAEKR